MFIFINFFICFLKMCGCSCTTCENTKNDIILCLFIYNKYKWLVDSYVLDYYVNNHWKSLPESWATFFENISPSEISYLLNPLNPLTSLKTVSPLEMLCLRKIFQKLNLPRDTIQIPNLYKKPMKHKIYKKFKDENKSESSILNDDDCLLNHPKLKNSFWKRINPKKKHEITAMAQICIAVAKHCDCNIVLDFGSGLGHLSRILAYGYGLKVCGLEAQQQLSKEAERLDLQFEVTASKHLSETQMKKLHRPVHINMKIETSTDLKNVIEIVKKSMNLNDDFKFGVIGLHPCGDLAAILLKFFKENHSVKFINVASCCYMKLTTETEKDCFAGYPLSKFLNSKTHNLSYISRELACHAIETYTERLNSGDYIELKTHAFRALLEKFIVKYWPDKSHTGLRSVKCNKEMTFYEYSTKALSGLDFTIPDDELLSPNNTKLLENWKNVVIYYTLRLMFAPMIETVVLLDRLLYVTESDTECALVPVFDPKLSPRNHILIATKNN